MQLLLKPTQIADLEQLFVFQLDEESNYLAAFTPQNPHDKTAYMQKWTRILANPEINMQTIWLGEQLCGSIAKFFIETDAEISYWLDRQLWGKGIATAALQQFLGIEHTRPLFGRTAFDNIASQRVLEKNGFVRIGTDKGFANARQSEIQEFIYKLA